MGITVGYSCKYAPVELIRALGGEPVALARGGAAPGTRTAATGSLHPNLCAFAGALYDAALDCDVAVLTDCCDSIRRTGDRLEADGRRPILLEVPHCRDRCGRLRFGSVLEEATCALEERCGMAFDPARLLRAWREAAGDERLGGDERAGGDESSGGNARPGGDERRCPDEPFVALIGARVSRGVVAQLRERLDVALVDDTCQAARRLMAPPPEAETMERGALIAAYADTLLDQVPCLRMADIVGRRALIEDPALVGVLYSTVKFCDFYPFEYATLSGELSVPLVKIESEYEASASEQTLTRVSALNETVRAAGPTGGRMGAQRERSTTEACDGGGGDYVVGIDSGSTSTNVVALDRAGAIRASAIVRTGAQAARSATEAIGRVSAALGVAVEDFRAIVGTGYGRNHLPFVTDSVTEISCHAKGAHRLDPRARAIIDIGGQDSKVIAVDANGAVETFAMNDKCAAGTGRFFEAMARTLELDLSTMAAMEDFRRDIELSSLCTVFAESEVIGLIADNCATADIVHGLNRAVATRTLGLARRVGARGPYLMTGGVARNRGLVAELERQLGEPIAVAEHPDMVGALGAALYALDHSSW